MSVHESVSVSNALILLEDIDPQSSFAFNFTMLLRVQSPAGHTWLSLSAEYPHGRKA